MRFGTFNSTWSGRRIVTGGGPERAGGWGARAARTTDLERLERRAEEALAVRMELGVLLVEDDEPAPLAGGELEQATEAAPCIGAIAQRAHVDDDGVEGTQIRDGDVGVTEVRPIQAEAARAEDAGQRVVAAAQQADAQPGRSLHVDLVHRQGDAGSPHADAEHVDARLAFACRSDLEAEQVAGHLAQHDVSALRFDRVPGGSAHLELRRDREPRVARDADAELQVATGGRQQQHARHHGQSDRRALFDRHGHVERYLEALDRDEEAHAYRRLEAIAAEAPRHGIGLGVVRQRDAHRQLGPHAIAIGAAGAVLADRVQVRDHTAESGDPQVDARRRRDMHPHGDRELLTRHDDRARWHVQFELHARKQQHEPFERGDAALQPRLHLVGLGASGWGVGRQGTQFQQCARAELERRFAACDPPRQFVRQDRFEARRLLARARPQVVVEHGTQPESDGSVTRRARRHPRFQAQFRLEHGVDRRRRTRTRVRVQQHVVGQPAEAGATNRLEHLGVDAQGRRGVAAAGAEEQLPHPMRRSIARKRAVGRQRHRFGQQFDQGEVVPVRLLGMVRRDHAVRADRAHETDQVAQGRFPPPLRKRLGGGSAIARVGAIQVPHLAGEARAARLGLQRSDAFERVAGLGTARVLATTAPGRQQDHDPQTMLMAQPDGRQHVAVIRMRGDEQHGGVGADVEQRLLQGDGAGRAAPDGVLPLLGAGCDRRRQRGKGGRRDPGVAPPATHQTPRARRLASTSGRPASRIFFCTAAMSYCTRRMAAISSSVSTRPYAARGSSSRGCPTLPTFISTRSKPRYEISASEWGTTWMSSGVASRRR
jgi:hypothetical protein